MPLICENDGGRYWDRISDLFGVKADPSRRILPRNSASARRRINGRSDSIQEVLRPFGERQSRSHANTRPGGSDLARPARSTPRAARSSNSLGPRPHRSGSGRLSSDVGSWTFFTSFLEQADHLGDAHRTMVRPALGGVDPRKPLVAVELRERVEVRRRGRGRLKAAAMSEPRSVRCGPSGSRTTSTSAPSCNGSQVQAGPSVRTGPFSRFSMAAHGTTVHRSGDRVARLGAPHPVGVEGDRDGGASAPIDPHRGTEPLQIAHGFIVTSWRVAPGETALGWCCSAAAHSWSSRPCSSPRTNKLLYGARVPLLICGTVSPC